MNTDHLGDVTIQGIHFKDSGLAGIVVANTLDKYNSSSTVAEK